MAEAATRVIPGLDKDGDDDEDEDEEDEEEEWNGADDVDEVADDELEDAAAPPGGWISTRRRLTMSSSPSRNTIASSFKGNTKPRVDSSWRAGMGAGTVEDDEVTIAGAKNRSAIAMTTSLTSVMRGWQRK